MSRREQSEPTFPLKLTEVQRQVVAEFNPDLSDRLNLDEPNQRVISLTQAELKEIEARAQVALQQAITGTKRRPLRLVLRSATVALDQANAPIPASERVYQFKITLLQTHPPIWRRIQVQDGPLDRLHEQIQLAMGWTNSHLYDFRIGEQRYTDPTLTAETFEELAYKDSLTTKISDLLPSEGQPFELQYRYDFGDCWDHEVLFEGVVRAKPRQKYPLCLAGARACPPEDVGGVWAYADFLEAIRNPAHEEHETMREWIGRRFDPEAFNPVKATREMRRGLPNWRGWV